MFEDLNITDSLKLRERLSDKELGKICAVIRKRITHLTGEKPVASVVISAYNEEMYMLCMLMAMSRIQTQYPLEFIGVDNASNDRTGEIFRESGFKSIHEPRKGISYARQAGLEAAQGDFVFCTDADVLVPTTWIDASIGHFNMNKNLVCFCGGVSGKTLGSSQFYSLLRLFVRSCIKTRTASRPNYFSSQNLIYRREAAMKSGGYTPGINLGEDGALVSKLRAHGDTLGIADNLETQVISSGRRTANIRLVAKMVLERKNRIFCSKSGGVVDFSDVR